MIWLKSFSEFMWNFWIVTYEVVDLYLLLVNLAKLDSQDIMF